MRKHAASIYQAQSNKVFDEVICRGRLRFGRAEISARQEILRPLIRCIRQGRPFNLPDMDFGMQDAAFVPFFGVPAATLLAPSRMARALDMVVQPVVAEILPRGRGYRVRFLPPWSVPSDDPMADASAMNRWIESEIERNPAQYLWVHKRFKTRPPGERRGCTERTTLVAVATPRRATAGPPRRARRMKLRFTKMQGAGEHGYRARRHPRPDQAHAAAVPAAGRPALRRRRGPDPHRRPGAVAAGGLQLPHRQRRRQRGRAVRQRRSLLREVRARPRAHRQTPHPRAGRPE